MARIATSSLTNIMRFIPIMLFLGSTLGGCAGPRVPDTYDPLESINRATFASYRALDRTTLRPAAVAYRDFSRPAFEGTGRFLRQASSLTPSWSSTKQVVTARLVANGKSGKSSEISSLTRM